jgi:predicted dehydrogenase
MHVGVIGTGAIAGKHAEAYRNIGFNISAVTDRTKSKGQEFAQKWGCEYVETPEQLCRRADVDYLDVCTFPAFRLAAVELAAKYRKHVLAQKPIAVDLETAGRMLAVVRDAGIQLGVVSQHRFDESTVFLKRAIEAGAFGEILQADAHVKWYRTSEYYEHPVKGSWAGEGGRALITQAIHQVDLLLYLVGAIDEVFGYWHLGAVHKIESDDLLCAVLRYASGATGVVQASTVLWPGYPERIEIHGTRGSAIVTGDQLTAWDVKEYEGEPPPIAQYTKSGASNPMSISSRPFERQFADFGKACNTGRSPVSSGVDGYRALQVVSSIYRSCAEGRKVRISSVES